MIRFELRSGRNPRLEEGDWSRPDDRFLPMRATDLVKVLATEAARFGASPSQVFALAEALQHLIDQETGTLERQLMDRYAPFNPDRDTHSLEPRGVPDDEAYAALHETLARLLDKANFEQLDEVQIEQAVLRARRRRLSVRVDPSRVERLEVWIRGQGTSIITCRPWWAPWRKEEHHIPIFRRLVVVAQLRGNPHVIIKAFKEIPEADVKSLLPHAEVTMSALDRLKLLGTSAGTLGLTITKLLKMFAAFAAFWYLAWVLVIGLVTLSVRALLGYRNARTQRNWERTRHLYFQNLGNNVPALQMLLATVKQEELKEILLAYLFCLPKEEGEPAAPRQIEHDIEAYLAERFGMRVDFDWPDAVEKLDRLDIWLSREESRVVPLDVAIERLQLLWRERRGIIWQPPTVSAG
jgi:hypothetical protein